MTYRRLYSIDPGLDGTGWAEWTQKKYPDRVGVISKPRPDLDLAERCHIISSELRHVIRERGGCTRQVRVVLEMPINMSGSAAGVAAQAGSIYKLTFLVGYIAGSLYPCVVETVSPMEWKGQLPKDVVARRIQNTLGEDVCVELGIKTHAWDAVGIGLWANKVWG